MNGAKSMSRRRRRDLRRAHTENWHHIHPSSRGGPATEDNLVCVDKRIHSAWHRVFSNATPREAFQIASSEPYAVAVKIIVALVAEFGTGLLASVSRSST